MQAVTGMIFYLGTSVSWAFAVPLTTAFSYGDGILNNATWPLKLMTS
jgi:hypothetical protein